MCQPFRIIGLSGRKGAGKSSVGKYLETKGFKCLSFADTIKDCLSLMFGWDRKLLEGDTTESRQFRETVDEQWSKDMGYKITPRNMMTRFGTECCRNGLGRDIWLNVLKRKIVQDSVITDVRFVNEFDFIHKLGGKVIDIRRGVEPCWIPVAKLAKSGDKSSQIYMQELGIHISEYDLCDVEFDYVIHNDDTIEKLFNKIEKILD